MWKEFVNDKVLNGILGRVFKSTRFSLTALGVVITAGLIGAVAPAALPWLWGGITIYVASETAAKILDAKYGNGRAEENGKKKPVKKSN